MTMNRTHKHSFHPEKRTIHYNQVLIFLFNIYLYIVKRLQKIFCWLIKKSSIKFWLLILNIVNTHLCDSSTGFGSLLSIFHLKWNLLSRSLCNIWTTYVLQPLFMQFLAWVALCHMEKNYSFNSVFFTFYQGRCKGCTIS